ncbi:MAG TPA: SigE family RNA polymerase sigma factor [Jiangellaceae bacterium]|nr:SigE family RNA polymerase sigma factor [Jiangellaceae bacterium]
MADLDDFAAFVASRSPHLARTAYLLTRDHGNAEDLLQTALAKSWLAWPRIDGDPERYVRRVLVNTYTTWWRRKWNDETPTAAIPETVAQPDAASAVAERDLLWHALGRLPKRQRAAIVLRFYEDMSIDETAELLGCTTGTVKSQTSKALTALRLDAELSQRTHGIEGASA